MKITQLRLQQIIKEELREVLDLKMLKHDDDSEKDWGSEGDRFDTDHLRSQFPLKSIEELEDDHIEIAIRDAIYDGEYSDDFAVAETMVAGMTNSEAVRAVLGDSVENMWQVWEKQRY